MSNIAGSNDSGRAGSSIANTDADGMQPPLKTHLVRALEIAKPIEALGAYDSVAFRSDAPRDVAMPSFRTGSSDAEPLKMNSLAFKSDAPRQTSDRAMLASTADAPRNALRPLTPDQLSAILAIHDVSRPASSSGFVGAVGGRQEPSRKTPVLEVGFFSRLWRRLRDATGLGGSP